MSRVYICDVCNKVNKSDDLYEFTRTYQQPKLFGVTTVMEITHICKNCWDKIKGKQTKEEVVNETKKSR
jgi:hypothetical protein